MGLRWWSLGKQATLATVALDITFWSGAITGSLILLWCIFSAPPKIHAGQKIQITELQKRLEPRVEITHNRDEGGIQETPGATVLKVSIRNVGASSIRKMWTFLALEPQPREWPQSASSMSAPQAVDLLPSSVPRCHIPVIEMRWGKGVVEGVFLVTPSQVIPMERENYTLTVTVGSEGPEAHARFRFYLDSIGRPWLEPIP